jgi:hypothetical protein
VGETHDHIAPLFFGQLAGWVPGRQFGPLCGANRSGGL